MMDDERLDEDRSLEEQGRGDYAGHDLLEISGDIAGVAPVGLELEVPRKGGKRK
jgi:hypothetical protein